MRHIYKYRRRSQRRIEGNARKKEKINICPKSRSHFTVHVLSPKNCRYNLPIIAHTCVRTIIEGRPENGAILVSAGMSTMGKIVVCLSIWPAGLRRAQFYARNSWDLRVSFHAEGEIKRANGKFTAAL